MGGETKLTLASSNKAQYPRHATGPVGKQIHSIYQGRLGQFTDNGQYREQGLLAKIVEARATGEEWVKLSVYSPPNLSRPSFKEATSHKFKPTEVGQFFGPSWSTHWFRVQLRIPEDLADKDHLEFIWDANNEGLIYHEHGEVVHGLTGGGERNEWILPKSWRDGKEHIFYVEMACNKMFGNAPGGDTIQPPATDTYFQLHTADIVAVNLDARQLRIDFWIIGDAAREFPGESWESHQALQVCNDIMDCFIAGQGSKECIKECRKIAQKYIGENVDSAKVYDSDKDAIVNGIGHCHIDTCWLWPWAETRRKIARSWSNQCDLMDRYPEHRFCCSQAQQYKWLERDYPELFDRVKAKVKKGTFQPVGGSWVEHDTNMPSGESLVRQFVYGQRFFESRFGQRHNTFWLPDTFGYSSQLPQLCRLAGMSNFFTQKLSWNNINNFPHTTFNWVALDGSQVMCHMAPAETYTAEAHFGDVTRSVTQHKSLDQDNTSLLVFGKGDGGGGPTWEHIEKLRRCRGISDNIGLLPRVTMGNSVDDFFARLDKKAAAGKEFITWYGELYFELHRGTYTTQANNKRNNRKAEIMLHDIEFLATYATVQDTIKGQKSKYRYPKKEIDEMWENVLLCQFHDCLPGSCIEMCYDDSDELYAKVFTIGEKLLADALEALGFDKNVSPDLRYTTENDLSTRYVALNTLAFDRQEQISLENVSPFESTPVRFGQIGVDPNKPLELRVKSSHHHHLARKASIQETSKDTYVLSNDHYRVEVCNGTITSLYDLVNKREIIAKNSKANQLVLYDDKPLYWQAWDVEVYHLRSRTELHAYKTSVAESGPHRVAVVSETQISEHSWIKTTVSLAASMHNCPSYVEVQCEVEWRETMKFLKVEFPVAFHNTQASYETQFGLVQRPTHYNTSWDMAKFEVCCHKWADLSENNYGVSIINDCKYGFATQGNVMRLSLLRAPKAPDAHADMGRHHFRYAILPHTGSVGPTTVKTAAAFNNPMRVAAHADPTGITSLLSSLRLEGDGANQIVLDTIKRGEDDEDISTGDLPARKGRSIIVRVYDALGGRSRATLVWGSLPVKSVKKCNLLEDDGEELSIVDAGEEKEKKGVEIEVKAFEVVSFRLSL